MAALPSPKHRDEIKLAADANKTFFKYRQRKICQSEAGGQLFGQIEHGVWHITDATGLRKGDIRSLFGFRPNRAAELAEIEEFYLKGLHYFGDWHTHPQRSPRPSPTDIASMQEMIGASRTDLPGFLMIIVGSTGDLHISFHQKSGWAAL